MGARVSGETSPSTVTGVAGSIPPSRLKRTLFRRELIGWLSRWSHDTSKGVGGEEAIMRFTYDPRYNIAYIRFQEKRSEVEAIRLSDEIVVDMAPNGTVYGIELLNANEQLARENQRNLVVVNEATGVQAELALGL
jgi:uncharacterized protein YuzE